MTVLHPSYPSCDCSIWREQVAGFLSLDSNNGAKSASTETCGFGGKARSASTETLEGDEETRRVVIIEFPDAAAARAWYESDEYQALKGIREDAGDGQFIIVDGFSEGAWLQAVADSESSA